MSLKEYKYGTAFNGVVGRTYDTSEQSWPEPRRAEEGVPNVLFIVLDAVAQINRVPKKYGDIKT